MMSPWLLLSPEWAHTLAPMGLQLFKRISRANSFQWKPLQWKGLSFSNRLGIAAGVDKEAAQILEWQHLGAGFMEVGTITPRPQGPNPGKILDRDSKRLALWNKMGFPGPGSEIVTQKILKLRLEQPSKVRFPLWINIGKNRDTPNDKASDDYCFLAKEFSPLADALVINISSPNTKGLRDLQDKSGLENLVESVRKVAPQKPLLLKLSPDLEEKALIEALNVSGAAGVNGWVLTNTTLSRESGMHFPFEGGVSGAPLCELSRRALRVAVKELGNEKKDRLLVSCGGVMTPDEVAFRLDQGADLIEVYTALAYHGPWFLRDVARKMTRHAN